MLAILFNSYIAAKEHRAHNGGWVFVAEDELTIIWFSPKFTSSEVMTHRFTRGLSGKLH